MAGCLLLLALSPAATPNNRPPHQQLLATAAPVQVTPATVPVPTSTTVTLPPEASRGRSVARPRPRVTSETPRPPSVPPAVGDCNAWGWSRSRAQSDACWRAGFEQYGGWDVDHMLRIVYCESHGDPWSGTRYVGILQEAGAESIRGNGAAQIELGHSIWERQGYGAWPVCQYH